VACRRSASAKDYETLRLVDKRPTPLPVLAGRAVRFDEFSSIHFYATHDFILHSAFFILPSFSRHRQFIKDFLDDRFAGLFLGLGFVGDGHADIMHSGAEMKSRERFGHDAIHANLNLPDFL
jgi:hypothetical protein